MAEGRGARCKLRTATQARPKAIPFRLRRVGKKTAVLALRGAHPADRAAIDAGGGYTGEKAAVKTRVLCLESKVAGVINRLGFVGCHVANDTRILILNQPFSDISLSHVAAYNPVRQSIVQIFQESTPCSCQLPFSRPTIFAALCRARSTRPWLRRWVALLAAWRGARVKPL